MLRKTMGTWKQERNPPPWIKFAVDAENKEHHHN